MQRQNRQNRGLCSYASRASGKKTSGHLPQNVFLVLLFVFSGMLVAFVFMSFFSLQILWRNSSSFWAFLHTIKIFTGWFVAYNPFVDLLTFFWKEASRPEILAFWRLLVFFFGGFLFPLLFVLRLVVSIKQEKPVFYAKKILNIFLIYFLLVSILSKGAWNPWYFSWLAPMLLMGTPKNGSTRRQDSSESARRAPSNMKTPPQRTIFRGTLMQRIGVQRRKALFWQYAFFYGLGLCYLPVVDLRFSGQWNMQEFFVSFFVVSVATFLVRYFFCVRKKIGLERC